MNKKNKVIAKWYTGQPQHFPYEYHKNWNALMPVVQKIEDMECRVHMCKNNCHIVKDENLICIVDGDTKILAVHEACYEFITGE